MGSDPDAERYGLATFMGNAAGAIRNYGLATFLGSVAG